LIKRDTIDIRSAVHTLITDEEAGLVSLSNGITAMLDEQKATNALLDSSGARMTQIICWVPRFQTRLAPGSTMQSPAMVKLSIHEAQTVGAEVSWIDTPFYSDPRTTRKSSREQLIGWDKGMAVGRGGKHEPPSTKAG
jgi:hypothetical protein